MLTCSGVDVLLVDQHSGPATRSVAAGLIPGAHKALTRLTLRDSSGHQVAYDPRYASPPMRTVYVTGSYNF